MIQAYIRHIYDISHNNLYNRLHPNTSTLCKLRVYNYGIALQYPEILGIPWYIDWIHRFIQRNSRNLWVHKISVEHTFVKATVKMSLHVSSLHFVAHDFSNMELSSEICHFLKYITVLLFKSYLKWFSLSKIVHIKDYIVIIIEHYSGRIIRQGVAIESVI